MENQLLHIKRFCALYACGMTKVYELIAAGEIVAVKIGGATRITGESAEAWASRLPRKHSRRSNDVRERRYDQREADGDAS